VKKIKFSNIALFGINLNRTVKQCIQVIFDISIIVLSLIAAMALRLETFSFLEMPLFYLSYVILVAPTIFIFAKLGLYQSLVRHISTEVVVLVAIGASLSFVLLIIAKITFVHFIPWTVPIIYEVLVFVGINGIRFIFRSAFRQRSNQNKKQIAIYGAGAAGAQTIQSLKSNQNYQVRMIIDDADNLQGKRMFGLKVMSFSEASNKFNQYGINIVLLAMPSAGFSARKEIISRLSNFSVEVKTVPGISSFIDGSVSINEFKDVDVEDLLGRETVKPDSNLLEKNITGKIVLVTGAGGSIGSELTRQIIKLKPAHLLLMDVSELAIYNIYNEVEELAFKFRIKLTPLVGSVCDQSCVSSILKENKIHTIYHAAAYKHVPLMEHNASQALKNNSFGTFVIANEAIRTGVSSFTLISTDKAVNPTNIMGASKRIAERICQSLSSKQKVTQFSIVRFGNVLGSSGSVIPLFKKQIEAGGPITVAHKDVTRYFMTINEAVELVIQASALSNGGDVFVLDMGSPVKIIDMAFKMVHLTGLTAYIENDETNNKGDIKIHFSGLRPGEKMFEELSYDKNLINTSHPRIMAVNEDAMPLVKIKEMISMLKENIEDNDIIEIKKLLIKYSNYISS